MFSVCLWRLGCAYRARVAKGLSTVAHWHRGMARVLYRWGAERVGVMLFRHRPMPQVVHGWWAKHVLVASRFTGWLDRRSPGEVKIVVALAGSRTGSAATLPVHAHPSAFSILVIVLGRILQQKI